MQCIVCISKVHAETHARAGRQMYVKRALPLLLKYFAVVGIACFLAFVISHTIASAQVVTPAVPSNANAAATEFAGYGAPGAYKIETALSIWKDTSRAREVPVKLYFPVTAAKTDAVKFPVILFSHGLGGSREGGKRWADHWASHGYVVVAMQHNGSDEALWKGAPPRDFADRMKAGMTMSNLGLRVDDVHFVIDEIIRRTAANEAAFANVDAKRIGMSGHSFGGQTTQAVAGQRVPSSDKQPALETRITAAIAFSANARNKTDLPRQFGGINLPFFSITGSEDGSILGDDTKPGDRRLPYANMQPGQKYLAVFDSGDHMVFGGHGFGLRRPETARDKKIQLDVMAGTLAFWNANLKQDAVARTWLDDGGYKATLVAKDIFEHK